MPSNTVLSGDITVGEADLRIMTAIYQKARSSFSSHRQFSVTTLCAIGQTAFIEPATGPTGEMPTVTHQAALKADGLSSFLMTRKPRWPQPN